MRHDLAQVAEEYGTPLYFLDLAGIRRTAEEFRHAWLSIIPTARFFFSYKTNPIPLVTHVHKTLGYGAEVTSGPELGWALEDGHLGRDIILNGPVKTDEELAGAIEAGALIQLDHPQEVDDAVRLARAAGRSARVGLRLRGRARGVEPMHFGMTAEEANAAAERIRSSPDLSLESIHMHLGTRIADPSRYAEAWAPFVDLARTLREENGRKPFMVDVGGGFASATTFGRDAAPPPPPQEFAKAIATILRPLIQSGAMLAVEPGRCLVESHGILLTRVASVKEMPDGSVAVLDGGVSHVPTVLKHDHSIAFVGERTHGRRKGWRLHGPLCMSSDVVAREVEGSTDLRRGDVVGIGDAGGYDMTGGFPWIRPHPQLLVVDGEKRHLIGRERPASLWR